jgi:hypothetical protein
VALAKADVPALRSPDEASNIQLGSLLSPVLAFKCSKDIADRGLRMHHNNHVQTVRLAAAITVAMVLAIAVGGERAYAQSIDDSSASASDSQPRASGGTGGAEIINVDGANEPAGSAVTTAAGPTDNSTSPPVADDSDEEAGPSAGTAVPDTTSNSAAENGAVLELPQVISLPSGNPDASADAASANTEGDDDDTAQAAQDPGTEDDPASPDQVGSLEDYENQKGAAPVGAILAPGVIIAPYPSAPLFNTLPSPPFGVPMATSPIILPPTSRGPFPSIGPILMPPIHTFRPFRGPRLMGFRR